MLRRLGALFARYAAAHLDATRPGFPLADEDGALLGGLDAVGIEGDRIRVTGWARAERVTLRGGGARAAMRPHLARADVMARHGIGPEVGFDLSARRPRLGPHHALTLTLDRRADGSDPITFVLPLPSPAWPTLRLGLAFAGALAVSLPAAALWRLTRDPVHRARVKRALGLELMPRAAPLDARALLPAPEGREAPGLPAPLAIVLPVFNAFDLLPEALDRVLRHTDLPWRLILVEDASTDPRVRPWLRDWAARAPAIGLGGQVELLENEANLGFIGAVNRGLARAREVGGPVVLLNSDALVPEGWASRLLAPMLADPTVASVTPLSNDAEILSAPAICRRLDLPPGAGDAIDRAARRLDPLAATAELPTGVGFCMALSPAFLARVPVLDPAFGRGYGEEVDWCQKVRALGGRHLGTGALFVEHRGGGSFGSEAKQALVLANNAIVSARYPGYDLEIQQTIADDPLATPRLALALAWAGAWSDRRAAEGHPDAAIPVYLAHALGGGAEMDLARRQREDLDASGRPSVTIRVGGPARWQVDLATPAGPTGGWTDDAALVRRLLEPLRRRHVAYSCGVGDPDGVELPALLLDLARDAEAASLEVLVHDYFPVSPSYTLLDSRGAFRGPVTPDAESARDPAHQARRPDGRRVPLAEWQAAWRPLMERAQVTAFSRSSLDLVLAAYPEAAPRARVLPHRLLAEVQPIDRPEGRRVIGALGNIGAHKGAALLRDLAALVPSPKDAPGGMAGLVLVGNIDPAFALPSHAPVHGSYDLAELPGIVRRYGITDWLIPSVWPETFSFTTREALATGLPVHAFAIGAQGEAVAAAPNGRPIPFGPRPPAAREVLAAIEAAP